MEKTATHDSKNMRRFEEVEETLEKKVFDAISATRLTFFKGTSCLEIFSSHKLIDK